MLEIKHLCKTPVKLLNCNKIIKFFPLDVYTDGSNKLVFISFKNLFGEALTSITFKISQFDENNKCLKREIRTLNDVLVKGKKIFTTEDLLKVDVMIDHAEIEIVNLTFITIVYDNGTLSSACVKVDKASKRHEQFHKKWQEKHPNRISKRHLREVNYFSFDNAIKLNGIFISVVIGLIMLIGVALIGCLYCKFPSSISPFFTMIKGGLF